MRSGHPEAGARARLSAALVAILVASLSGGALAGDLKGLGTARCSELNGAWQEADNTVKSAFVVAIGQWAFGYMTGRNIENPSAERRELAGFDNDATAVFILEQCRAHPDFYVIRIVDALYDSAPRLRVGA